MFIPKSVLLRADCIRLILDRRAARWLPIIILSLTADSARATDYTWNNAAGGSFQTTANWLPDGLPGTGDTVIFGNPTGSYSVTSTGSVTNTGLQVSQGSPTLALTSGQTFTVTGLQGFTIGTTTGQVGTLTITGGTLSVTNDNSTIGRGLGTTGKLILDGTGTTFTNNSFLSVANEGTGTLTVQNSAVAQIGQTYVGFHSTGNGTINVVGSGSSLALGQFSLIGGVGTGTVSIAGGGTASIGDGLTVGQSSGSGTIDVNASGTLTLGATTAIGNGPGTNGKLNVNSGGTLNANGNLTINTGGSATLNGTWNQNSGLITVAGGALNLNGGNLNTTASGTGINVSSGSVTVAAGFHTVRNLTRTGSGILTLNGGTVTVVGALDHGNTGLKVDGSSASVNPKLTLNSGATTNGITDLTVGSSQSGSVNVFGGSTLNASSLTAGQNAGSSGDITVSGSNSKIQLSGGDGATIGFYGTGSLNINGNSTTSINTNGGSIIAGYQAGSSGTLDIAGGTLAMGGGWLTLGYDGNASLNLSAGGTITQGSGVGIIGVRHGTNASATINGVGSKWTAESIEVENGTLVVQNNGAVNTTIAYVGNGGYGSVSLTGGGTWACTDSFNIGATGGFGGAATVHVNSGGQLTAVGAAPIRLLFGGTLDIAGGAVTTGAINAGTNSNQIVWSSGSLTVTGAGGLVLANSTFGNGLTLGIPHTLTVTNTLTVPNGQTLTLAGSNVTAGSLSNAGAFNLQTGTLTVTNSTLSIGTGGPLGALVTAGPGLNLRVTGAAQTLAVAADGLLNITGGSVAGTSITNAGEIDFGSPVAALGLAGQAFTNTGRVAGTGRINANLANNANGQIIVDAGQRLVFAGSTNNNNLNGAIELTGGTAEFTGTLTNNAGGSISGRGTLRGSSASSSGTGLANSGVVAFSGGFSDVFGNVNNQGGGTGGQIINAGAGTLTFHNNLIHNGKEIRTVAGGRTVIMGTLSGAGPFTGTGTIESNGNLLPGNSAARVTFGGDLILGDSATLYMELGGTNPTTQFDQLQIAGQLSLAGALSVSLISGFMPSAGNSFDILDWGSLAGTFSSFNLAPLLGSLAWDTSQLYINGRLSVANTGIPGDYNGDNKVDAADYVVWRKTQVNGQQGYQTWRANFGLPSGNGSSSAGGSPSQVAVPEPATLLPLMIAAIGCCLLRRRGA